jgi:FkbM family methyltransferase
MQFINKIRTAFKKFIFCYTITADLSSFIKLVWFTKKYKWNKNKLSFNYNAIVKYSVNLNNQLRTIYLRTYSGDIDIFYEIFFKKVYKTDGNNASCFIIDAGANIGLATVYFLLKYRNAKIICIEPDPENIVIFKLNLAKQIASGAVELVEAALAKADGEMFLAQPKLKYNSKLVHKYSGDNCVAVKTVSLQNILSTKDITNIEFIKIDIEGAEENMFSGNTNWLQNIAEVMIETHSAKAKEAVFAGLYANKFVLQKSEQSIYHFKKLSGQGRLL